MKLVCGECGREVKKLLLVVLETGENKSVCGNCLRVIRRKLKKAAS
ncbi:MAG: hypothetical protein QXS27_03740 [Candidatus Jordarchaeaceae archaeon]